MSKSLIAAVSTTAVAATAIPTTFLASKVGSDNDNVQLNERTTSEIKVFTKPTWTSKLIPQLSSASEITKEYLKVDCLKEYYGRVNWTGTVTSDIDFNDIKDFSNDSETKSCLIIEYYKHTYRNKWWGEFRLIWSVKDETNKQGLVTVINLHTNKGKISRNSSAYTLKKDDSSNWIASRNKETNVNEFSDENQLFASIPRNNSAFREKVEQDYWGFNPSMNNICSINNCSEPDNNGKTHNSYAWEWIGGSGDNFAHSWSVDVGEWLNSNFGWKNLTDKMYNAKGNWKEKR